MSQKTKIEWCDSTWNPVTGCRHGCDYCYARRQAERFRPKEEIPRLGGKPGEGYELDNKIMSVCADGKERPAPYPYGFEPTLFRYRLNQPKKWKKPQNIFVCSMADLFGEWVPQEWINEVFTAAAEAPQHRYLFLTKNPERMHEILKWTNVDNWWFGTTITKTSDNFVISTSRKRHIFLSIEPIMEDFGDSGRHYEDEVYGETDLLTKVEWVIIGAETGNRKDKVVPKPEWIQHITDRCDAKGVPVFMKDSLIPIIGAEKMRREFPWDDRTLKDAGKEAGQYADTPTLMSGT